MEASSLPTTPEKVSPPHTALLVVDMQHDYCSEGGAFARSGSDMTAIRALFPRFRSFLETARGRGVTTVIIGTFRDENDVSLPMRELRAKRGQKGTICQRGSRGTDFIPGVQPRAGDIVVEKKRYSAFFGTGLDEKLRQNGIHTLIVIGVVTNVCVQATVQDGFMRDYFIVVPADLVASTDENFHRNALLIFERYYGAVTSSKELLRIWESKS